jgi:hypothetical protein
LPTKSLETLDFADFGIIKEIITDIFYKVLRKVILGNFLVLEIAIKEAADETDTELMKIYLHNDILRYTINILNIF